MTVNDSQDAATSWDALPAPIKTYLTAHAGRESAKVLSAFTADAVVTDEGRDYRGREEINSWLDGPASEYTYTTEFTNATTADAATVDVMQHLEGDFPGGVADLHFRFALDGALISRLVIEP
jgi:ketosteroid isomerase-like protein